MLLQCKLNATLICIEVTGCFKGTRREWKENNGGLNRLREVKNYNGLVSVNAEAASCVCELAIAEVRCLSSHRD